LFSSFLTKGLPVADAVCHCARECVAGAAMIAPTLESDLRADLRALDDFLNSDHAPPGAPYLSTLDGFLAGLAAGPEIVPVEEWLEFVYGAQGPLGDEDEFSSMLSATVNRYNEIVVQLADGTFNPLIAAGEDGTLNLADWVDGFIAAVGLRSDAWRRLFESEHAGKLLWPILVHGRNEKDKPLLDLTPEKEEMAENTIELIPLCVMSIAGFWQFGPEDLEPPARGSKVGSNTPCPCGSGKKFKNCCG
jgi:uncharacterized protein